MKRILCPTDFSEIANHSIAYSAMLSKRAKAKLTLLNVLSLFPWPEVETYVIAEAIRERLEDQSRQVSKDFDITCLAELEPTKKDLNDIISQYANDFDLIVMGTNGASDEFKSLFGSRSYQVAKESSVPVLVVPAGCKYKDISTILYAYDYESEEDLPIRQLIEWTNLLHVKIIVLQVKKYFTHEADVNAKSMEERIKRINPLSDIEFITIFSDEVVSDTIAGYMRKSGADILALCSVDHTVIDILFRESVIKSLTSLASFPIFIFHDNGQDDETLVGFEKLSNTQKKTQTTSDTCNTFLQ